MADTILPAHPKTLAAYKKPHLRSSQPSQRIVRSRPSQYAALEQAGIFDPLMIQVLDRQSEQLRAGVNYHLLGAMRRIEERDRERSLNHPTSKIPNPNPP